MSYQNLIEDSGLLTSEVDLFKSAKKIIVMS